MADDGWFGGTGKFSTPDLFSGQVVNLQLNGISSGTIPDVFISDSFQPNVGGLRHDALFMPFTSDLSLLSLSDYWNHMSDFTNVFGAMYENRGFTATTAAGSSVGGGGGGDYLP
ncbi:MAG: hypothetical protein PHS80_05665 [Methanothrix sp.]|nr:hypothetical protein [Methanothrix sp.]MDD4446600.1 hypothetical protein [Methanothrix sp.]